MKTDTHWEKIGFHAHHGICIPLFSLRTKNNCGIGEFFDLFPLIDWCKSLGFDCLQLLPLNDSGADPSPYNPLSSCALDPIYLSLHKISGFTGTLEVFEPYRSLPLLARSEIKKLKLEQLRRMFKTTGSLLAASADYQLFLKKHPWLYDYARFMACKTAFKGVHWNEWPLVFEEDKHKEEMNFHSFLQYHCFDQLKQVSAYATSRSFFLIGDIPILLSPDSADVWAQKHLFRLDFAAGAPPDQYAILGQNWGFPLFDWEAMRREKFGWWKRRLAAVEDLYHIYRLDHVVGFFRIWAIPKGNPPVEGHFEPPDPSIWPNRGQEVLEMMIDSSPLLPIAEDLGTIPLEVYPILKHLGICGTKVLRWQESIPYREYEPFSMTTVSTPDTDLLPLWWKTNPEKATAFAHFKHWTYQPILSGQQQLEILKDAHHTSSYFHINLLQEYLYPFPDLIRSNLEEERMNIPGTLLPMNWTYRFRAYLEDIVRHKPLKAAIQEILSDNTKHNKTNPNK